MQTVSGEDRVGEFNTDIYGDREKQSKEGGRCKGLIIEVGMSWRNSSLADKLFVRLRECGIEQSPGCYTGPGDDRSRYGLTGGRRRPSSGLAESFVSDSIRNEWGAAATLVPTVSPPHIDHSRNSKQKMNCQRGAFPYWIQRNATRSPQTISLVRERDQLFVSPSTADWRHI